MHTKFSPHRRAETIKSKWMIKVIDFGNSWLLHFAFSLSLSLVLFLFLYLFLFLIFFSFSFSFPFSLSLSLSPESSIRTTRLFCEPVRSKDYLFLLQRKLRLLEKEWPSRQIFNNFSFLVLENTNISMTALLVDECLHSLEFTNWFRQLSSEYDTSFDLTKSLFVNRISNKHS